MSHQIQNINTETKIIFSKKDQNQIKILFPWPLVQRLDPADLWPWRWAWAQKWHLRACGFHPSVAENRALALLSRSFPHWPGGRSPSPEPRVSAYPILLLLSLGRGSERPPLTQIWGFIFALRVGASLREPRRYSWESAMTEMKNSKKMLNNRFELTGKEPGNLHEGQLSYSIWETERKNNE